MKICFSSEEANMSGAKQIWHCNGDPTCYLLEMSASTNCTDFTLLFRERCSIFLRKKLSWILASIGAWCYGSLALCKKNKWCFVHKQWIVPAQNMLALERHLSCSQIWEYWETIQSARRLLLPCCKIAEIAKMNFKIFNSSWTLLYKKKKEIVIVVFNTWMHGYQFTYVRSGSLN